jgi:hypothetical protein
VHWFQVNVKEIAVIVAVSVLLTVAVEMPFNNLRMAFVKKSFRHVPEAVGCDSKND